MTTLEQIEKQQKRGKKNGKENNCVDILSEKLVRLHVRRHEYGFRKEIESLRIAAQNNAIDTNYMKSKIDNTQQNGKRRFCADKDEISKKLVILVEGDLKAPISIATTPRCRGGCHSFPRIVPLYP